MLQAGLGWYACLPDAVDGLVDIFVGSLYDFLLLCMSYFSITTLNNSLSLSIWSIIEFPQYYCFFYYSLYLSVFLNIDMIRTEQSKIDYHNLVISPPPPPPPSRWLKK